MCVLQVENLTLGLVLSTTTNITDLIEDEKVPESMPLLILVSNCDINLKVRSHIYMYKRSKKNVQSYGMPSSYHLVIYS